MLRPAATRSALFLATLAAAIVTLGSSDAAAGGGACGRLGHAHPQKLGRAEAARSTQCLLNRVRAAHGLESLGYDRRLARGAKRHSAYMQRHRCFRHRCRGEATVAQRLIRAGYLASGLRRWAYGENIAFGEGALGSPAEIVESLMHSPRHRKKILDPDYREVGVGFLRGTHRGRQQSGGLYTIELGLRLAY